MLQALHTFFTPGMASPSHAAQQQVQLLREAMLLKAWVQRLPEILAVIDQYNLDSCKGGAEAALQTMLTESKDRFPVKDVHKHLAAVEGACGKCTPAELELFNAVKHCDAFFNFLRDQQFFGRYSS